MAAYKRVIQFPPRPSKLCAEPDILSPAEYDDLVRELDTMKSSKLREFDVGELRKPVRSPSLDGPARAGKPL